VKPTLTGQSWSNQPPKKNLRYFSFLPPIYTSWGGGRVTHTHGQGARKKRERKKEERREKGEKRERKKKEERERKEEKEKEEEEEEEIKVLCFRANSR